MSIMGLLFNISLLCFNVIAWPLLALGYPLCASIQPIEANSNSKTRKLITYWVCFSFILLFDHAFLCPRIVFDRFIKMLDIITKEDNPLTTKETESQALQNLVAFKGKMERPKVEQKNVNAEEIKEKNEFSSKPKGQPLEASVATANSAQSSGEVSDSKSSQTLWGCVLCKVKCTGKINLISHFQGKRHLKALERLKANPTAKFKPWTCEICKKELKNKNDLNLHLRSKRHQKMEAKRYVQGEVSSVWKKL